MALNQIIRENPPKVTANDALECAGCRQEFPKAQLITVHEGRHDNLHFFSGDRVCRPCARANGVAY
jgi:hypothetical protein